MKIIENISNIEPELDCNSDILDVAREVALNSEQDSAFLVCDLNTITRNYQASKNPQSLIAWMLFRGERGPPPLKRDTLLEEKEGF